MLNIVFTTPYKQCDQRDSKLEQALQIIDHIIAEFNANATL
jgi:predicted kinase